MSVLISHMEAFVKLTSGKQKEYWEWKVQNAKLLKHVKTNEIRRDYPDIDYYLKHHEYDVNFKECFRNAGNMCINVKNVKYVEGEISYKGIPLDHAWNKIDDKYFDITKDILFPKNSDYAEYVSIIEMNKEEYIKFILKYKHWGGFIAEKFLKEKKKVNESFYPRLTLNII